MQALRTTGSVAHPGDALTADAHRLARFNHNVVPVIDELRRAALRLTRHHADAEDLLQVTLEKAWLGIDSFHDGTNARAWLHRIMANERISLYRRAQRRPTEQTLDDAATSKLVTDSAEAVVVNNQPDGELGRAMRTLPYGQRIAIYYAFVEGRRHSEIAEILGIPVGTVMSRVFRARRTLVAELQTASPVQYDAA